MQQYSRIQVKARSGKLQNEWLLSIGLVESRVSIEQLDVSNSHNINFATLQKIRHLYEKSTENGIYIVICTFARRKAYLWNAILKMTRSNCFTFA